MITGPPLGVPAKKPMLGASTECSDSALVTSTTVASLTRPSLSSCPLMQSSPSYFRPCQGGAGMCVAAQDMFVALRHVALGSMQPGPSGSEATLAWF